MPLSIHASATPELWGEPMTTDSITTTELDEGDVATALSPQYTLTSEYALARHKRLPRPATIAALIWLGGLAFLAIFATRLPFVRSYSATNGPDSIKYGFGPSREFWFGTDKLGRDVFARCVYGAQKTLVIAISSISVGLIIGGALGMLAGYFRKWTDRTFSIAFDVLLSFPALVLALVIARRFPDDRFVGVIFTLSLLSIAPLGRIVRAQTLSLSQREYVLAARGIGAKGPRVMLREILPNLIPAMMSVAFTGLAVLLVAEGGLAFLGYSVQVPSPTWGYMMNESRSDLEEAWWATLMPCMMLFLTVLAFNVLGDRLARKFDIREATL
jgi:peptide/nickel transport system permease protein